MNNPVAYSIVAVTLIANVLVWLYAKNLRDYPKELTKGESLYMKLLPLVTLGISLLYVWRSDSVEILFSCRYMLLLVLVWLIALIDHRCKLIPNQLLIVGLVARGLLLVPEILYYKSSLLSELIYELIGCVLLFVLCILMRVISKNGLGMGDVKLFTIVPLFLGTNSGMQMLLYSMVAVFFEALYLLITKKASKKDSVAFAPAILVGTLLLTFSLIF